MDNDLIGWDIYLKKDGEIIGLHAVGYPGPYEYTLTHLDGTIEEKTSHIMTMEQWGNEYDSEYNMLGRGSFRVFSLDIEEAAKELEADGWVRFERETKCQLKKQT